MDDGIRDHVGYYFGRTMSEPTRVKVSPPREDAIADAIALLERNGYEVRRKDAPPVADEADQAATLASNAQGGR